MRTRAIRAIGNSAEAISCEPWEVAVELQKMVLENPRVWRVGQVSEPSNTIISLSQVCQEICANDRKRRDEGFTLI